MLFISFEGIDGSGKSTQARLLAEYLQEAGHDPLLLREPGGTEVSERVRSLLLDPSFNVQPFAELLLFSAARAQLVHERIRPALEQGRIVICDRFYDSTTAYQGAGREVADPDWLVSLHERVTGGVVPDRTYLVDVDLDTARRRGTETGTDDRMEAAGEAFYRRVRGAYDTLAEEHPDRIHRVDGTNAIETVHEAVRSDVEALLAEEQD